MGSNIYIPLKGDSNSFFERLSDYIKRFDSNWKNVIRGASSEKIDKYLELATQNKQQLVIPEEYIVYLNKMGEDDGGLLENFIKGSTNIDVLIDHFENMNKFPDYYDPIPLNHVVIGHSIEVETDIFLNYNNDLDYEINRTVSINPESQAYNWFSSSFEKLLFQSVLFKYIGTTKKCVKECVVPTNFIKEKKVIDATKVMRQIDEVCQKYGMSKIWISDQYNYIAYNDIGIVYMKLDFNLYGDVWSDDEQFATELSNSIKNIWGYDAS